MKPLKHYYIIDGFVEGYNIAYNPQFFKYEKLSDEQVEFYLANKKAKVSEIREMKLKAKNV